MLAITSPTGKLGTATITALLTHSLIPPSQLVVLTSSPTPSPKFTTYKEQGAQVRSFDYASPHPSTFKDVTKLFLISSPVISLDFNDAPNGTGREKHHIDTVEAAIKGGVKEVVYTSLAFGGDSQAGVMRAHLRTEQYLKSLEREGKCKVTVLRMGLYSESWPLYLGYFGQLPGNVNGVKGEERGEVVVAGDGRVSWTPIPVLGVGAAVVLGDESGKWWGETRYLSLAGKEGVLDLKSVAKIVGEKRGEVRVRVVERREYVEEYVGRGMERESVEWWVSSYEALGRGECDVKDGTLGELVRGLEGVEVGDMESVVGAMFV